MTSSFNTQSSDVVFASEEENNKPKILHIDDEEDFLTIFKIFFGKRLEITSISDESEISNQISSLKYDVLITDYEMPKLKGLELLKGLKENRVEIPVIFLTGQGNESIAREAFKLGAFDYFTKDFHGFAQKEKLMNSITRAVETTRIEKEKRKSEAKLREIVENLNDMVYSLSPDGIISYISPASRAIIGFEPSEVQGRTFLDFVHPDDRKRMIERFRKLALGKTQPDKFRLLDKYGGFHWVRTSTQSRFEGERIVEYFGVLTDVTEQELAEEELINTQRLLKTAIEQSPAGIIIADAPDAKIRIANSTAIGISGRGKEKLTRITLNRHPDQWQTYYPDEKTIYKPEDLPLSRAILKGETIKNQEVVIKRPDGEIRWILANAAPVKDLDGKIIAGVAVFPDITEQKIAIKKLKESEEKFHSLYSALSEGVCLHEMIYDEAGRPVDYRILDVNPAFQAITGIDRKRALGKPASELYGTGKPPYIDIYEKVARTGESATFETYFPPMNKHFLISVSSPHRGQFATIFMDVTEIRLAQQSLKKSEERLAMALDATSDAMWDLNLQTGSSYFSPRYYTMLEYEPYEIPITIETWIKMLHHEDRENAEKALNRLINNETSSFEIEFRMKTKTGKWQWILSRGKAMEYDKKGKLTRIVGTHVNITRRKEAEAAILRERDRAEKYLNVAGVIMVAVNADQKIILINQKGCEVTGYSEDEIIGKNWFDMFIPGEIREKVKEVFNRLMTGKIEPLKYYENPIITKSGRERIIAWHNTIIKDQDGKIISTLSSGEDITEIILNKNRIEHLNRVLKAIRDVNQLIVKEKDREALIEKACRMLTETRGYKSAWIILLNEKERPYLGAQSGCREPFKKIYEAFIQKGIPPCARQKLKDKEVAVIDTEKEELCHNLQPTSEKTIMMGRLSYEGELYGIISVALPVLIEADSGEIDLFHEMCEDLAYSLHNIKQSERRQVILEALKQKDLASHNIDIAGVLIMSLNLQGNVTMINRKGADIIGLDESHITGRQWFDFIADESKPEARALFRAIINHKDNMVENHECRIKNVWGEKRYLSMTSTLIIDKTGEKIGILCTGEDITERKNLEIQLTNSLREKEILLKEINHRAKNNLQIISSLIDFQIRKIQDEKAIEILQKSIDRLGTMALIHESLYEAKDIFNIDFNRYLKRLLTNIVFSYQLAPKCLKYEIDAGDIKLDAKTATPCALIVNELVTNSLKYAFPNGKKGKIDVIFREENDEYVLSVQDNGIGIPEEIDPNLAKTLGLRIVYLLTGQLNGVLEIRREQGTRITVRFPVNRQ